MLGVSILMLEGRSWVNQGQNSDMGEGGVKNEQKNSDVFYGRPLTHFLSHKTKKINIFWVKEIKNFKS